MSRTMLVNESRLERFIIIMRCTSSGTRILGLWVSGDISAAATCARFSDGFLEEPDTRIVCNTERALWTEMQKCQNTRRSQ